MKSTVTAIWQGNFKEGNGFLKGENSTLEGVEYKPVFAKASGQPITNPEELLGSAHATCFNMTLSYILSQAGISAESLQTEVVIGINNNVILSSTLNLVAKIPGIADKEFQDYVIKAKQMCAVGNALKVEIEVNAQLL
ncbi:peroxiredoxin, OsmC subfamily [Myroides sp. A21]|uniref:OsmC family protein n=1 Tax=Myroides sp. A21 TaxID=1583100 RepID=UPI00057F994B|nr:OsmC family peroxiredoxin [Myroides sp. A21]AJA67393.1 peroxiredoxin, OsmC subfamily [Myroides sp. A21]